MRGTQLALLKLRRLSAGVSFLLSIMVQVATGWPAFAGHDNWVLGMTADLSGRIALITGASRGIGRAAAIALAGAGAHVILVARTVGGLEEADDEIQKIGGTATLVP